MTAIDAVRARLQRDLSLRLIHRDTAGDVQALLDSHAELQKHGEEYRQKIRDLYRDKYSREEELASVQALIDGQASVHSDAVVWVNRCNRTVPEALRYLANHRRPDGGEQRFNAAHLFQLADEIEHMASAPLYAVPMQPTKGEGE